ncbi:hypothetical protein Pcinc_012193 [Petrolisthes cinctipes]|uniref:Uncharacterized protein n=1 Tax=Petrolisthes cinctipes TaxID=88211 RepID=A0AAE1KSU1_PETCI|nr:hypothetical protein Pcinc_012193 [Petrolisthes cinctipes]
MTWENKVSRCESEEESTATETDFELKQEKGSETVPVTLKAENGSEVREFVWIQVTGFSDCVGFSAVARKLPAEARVSLATLHNASTNDYITAADRVVVEIPTNPARVSSNNAASSSTVFSTLLLSGKLQQREVVKAAPPALVSETTPLLQVIDRSSGSKFLVDTGASPWVLQSMCGFAMMGIVDLCSEVISKSSKYFTIQGPRREETVTIDRLKPAIVPSTTNDGVPVGSSQTPGEIYISVPSPPPSPAPELPHSSTSTDLKTDPLKIEPLVASPLKAESDISFSDSAGAKQCPQEVTTRSGRVSRPPDRYTSMVSLGPALTTRRGGGYCGASKPPQRQFTYTKPPQRQFTHTQPPQHTKLPQRQFTGFTRAHQLVHSKSCETNQASEASTQKYISAGNLEKGREQHTPPLQPVLSLDRPPSRPPEHRPGPLDRPPCHCGKFSRSTSL